MPRKKNGRVKNSDRIKAAWKASGLKWPLPVGEKVKLFNPKDGRGRVVKVIAAGKDKAEISTRRAPKGKVRVLLRHKGGYTDQFSVSQLDVFPNSYKLKELEAIL
jgi:hypothetical protein